MPNDIVLSGKYTYRGFIDYVFSRIGNKVSKFSLSDRIFYFYFLVLDRINIVKAIIFTNLLMKMYKLFIRFSSSEFINSIRMKIKKLF
jgi:hypothetical protein